MISSKIFNSFCADASNFCSNSPMLSNTWAVYSTIMYIARKILTFTFSGGESFF
jgi:hypothetical protein